MHVDDNRYTVSRQDQIVTELLALRMGTTHEVRQAGQRIMDCIHTRTAKEIAGRQASIRAERARIERAREIVLGLGPGEGEGEGDRALRMGGRVQIRGLVEVLREYHAKHKNLDVVPAMDAYLTDYAERWRAGQVARGRKPTPAGKLMAQRSRELDPDSATSDLHTLPYQLGQQVLMMMRQDPDRVRLTSEWWEVVVLVLSIECPDLSAHDLGLVGDLPWGAWEIPGRTNTFGHRDGMRAYIGRASWEDTKQVNDQLFWTLAERAAVRLRPVPSRDPVPPIPSGHAPVPRASAGRPLVGWDEICGALEIPNNRQKQDWLKALNRKTGGPIAWVGNKPEADEQELLLWIADREARAEALKEARSSKAAFKKELGERDGLHLQDLGMHSEKRPNAKGRAGPAPTDEAE